MSNQAGVFFETCIPDAQERALVEGIQAHPDEPARRLIYADYLEEHSSDKNVLRAQFLRLQVASPQDGRLGALRPHLGWDWLSALGFTRSQLHDLQRRTAEEYAGGGWKDFLNVTSERGLIDVHFQGNSHAACFDELLSRLVDFDLAAVLRSVRLDFCGERGFANGTCSIDIDWLSGSPREFPWLTTFEICRDLPGLILGDDGEQGAIGRLLRKCRALETLAMPSAPDASFFSEDTTYPLRSLAINAGYDTQHFLRNLARSTCFPSLRHLEYLDFCEDYVDGWEQSTTPFEDYLAFFRSPLLAQLETAVLRVTTLDAGQIEQLLDIRSEGVSLTLWNA